MSSEISFFDIKLKDYANPPFAKMTILQTMSYEKIFDKNAFFSIFCIFS